MATNEPFPPIKPGPETAIIRPIKVGWGNATPKPQGSAPMPPSVDRGGSRPSGWPGGEE